MLALAVAGLGLALAGRQLAQDLRREKEAELLFVGDQIRVAIEQYHARNNTGQQPWPQDLNALLRDPYQAGVVRYLRQPWRDPLNPRGEWVLLRTQGNGIVGVRPASAEKPLKTGGFPKAYESFQTARRYSDWKFLANGGVPMPEPGAEIAPDQAPSSARPQPANTGTQSPGANRLLAPR